MFGSIINKIVNLSFFSVVIFISMQLLGYFKGITYNLNIIDYLILTFIIMVLNKVVELIMMGVVARLILEKFNKGELSSKK